MALYDTLFGMMDLQAAQLLVTPRDFRDEAFKVRRPNLIFPENHAVGAGTVPFLSGMRCAKSRLLYPLP